MERTKKEISEKLGVTRHHISKWLKELNIKSCGNKEISTGKFTMLIPIFSEDDYQLLKLKKEEETKIGKRTHRVDTIEGYVTREEISKMIGLEKSPTNERLSDLQLEYIVKGTGSRRYYKKSDIVKAFKLDNKKELTDHEMIKALYDKIIGNNNAV